MCPGRTVDVSDDVPLIGEGIELNRDAVVDAGSVAKATVTRLPLRPVRVPSIPMPSFGSRMRIRRQEMAVVADCREFALVEWSET